MNSQCVQQRKDRKGHSCIHLLSPVFLLTASPFPAFIYHSWPFPPSRLSGVHKQNSGTHAAQLRADDISLAVNLRHSLHTSRAIKIAFIQKTVCNPNKCY